MQVTAGDAKSYGQECLYPMNRCATVESVAGVRVARQTGITRFTRSSESEFSPNRLRRAERYVQHRRPNGQRVFAGGVNADEGPERCRQIDWCRRLTTAARNRFGTSSTSNHRTSGPRDDAHLRFSRSLSTWIAMTVRRFLLLGTDRG